MLNKLLVGACSILAAFSVAASATASKLRIELNTQKTKIEWTVEDVLHTVHGTFQLKRGSITFDPATRAVSGEIVVDTASGESGNGPRDRRMRKYVLETQHYPEATFVPAKVEGAIAVRGTSSARVTGTLDIHGSKHEITIPMNFDISGMEAKAAGTFIVPYVAWGMKDPSTFVLRMEKTVEVQLNAVGYLGDSTSRNPTLEAPIAASPLPRPPGR